MDVPSAFLDSPSFGHNILHFGYFDSIYIIVCLLAMITKVGLGFGQQQPVRFRASALDCYSGRDDTILLVHHDVPRPRSLACNVLTRCRIQRRSQVQTILLLRSHKVQDATVPGVELAVENGLLPRVLGNFLPPPFGTALLGPPGAGSNMSRLHDEAGKLVSECLPVECDVIRGSARFRNDGDDSYGDLDPLVL